MHRDNNRFRALLMLGLLVIAALLTSCQLLEEAVTTVSAPNDRPRPSSTSEAADESPRITNPQEIPPTWTPAVQIQSELPAPLPAQATVPEAGEPAGEQRSYTVQSGDTLAEIALRYNVPMDELARANDIQDLDHIEVGQVLVIPGF